MNYVLKQHVRSKQSFSQSKLRLSDISLDVKITFRVCTFNGNSSSFHVVLVCYLRSERQDGISIYKISVLKETPGPRQRTSQHIC